MADAFAPGGSPDAWALEARGLGKRYRRGWALRDCSFRLPAGRICGLVGPNGAGKSTLLGLATQQIQPTEGELRIFGVPAGDAATRPRTAFLGQDKPLFKGFTVAETLRLGAELNPAWDMASAERIVEAGRIPTDARIGTLSGGQHTRVAFALAFGKRPDLLLLDEPMADLDPLARHDLGSLMLAEAAERGITVVMSSHLLSELEDMCDHLLVLAEGRVRLAGDTDAIVPAHLLVTGRVADGDPLAPLAPHTVVDHRVQGRQFQALIRPNGPLRPEWAVAEPTLEEVLLAHLRSPDAPPPHTPAARHEAEGNPTA
ncbi:ABC transporter ATP-binding protein [Kitasatospora sp. NPDC036755]|uniref:ABC transporter ATP-binding protein n=1 Tax=Kitasatospora sp. NPDC036755 TaxID=3154600 RepID=UPI00340152FF